MKKLTVLLLAFTGSSLSVIQAQPDGNAARQEMKKFAEWTGTWKGSSSIQMGDRVGQSQVEEHLQWKLDGLILMMEGTGKRVDPSTGQEKIVHNALGLLTYDSNTKEFKMRSYLGDGRSTDAWFKVIDANHFLWGFDAGPGKMKYAITTDPVAKTWKEVGEYSADGNSWQKVFEMNLTKQP